MPAEFPVVVILRRASRGQAKELVNKQESDKCHDDEKKELKKKKKMAMVAGEAQNSGCYNQGD